MIITNKKTIIFFDGDGTLWYPKTTKHTVKPHWIYKDSSIKNPLSYLMLTPGTEQTLKELKKRGILCVILSTHPKNLQNTQKILEDKILHFRLKDYFFELHATEEFHGSKGDFIIKILQKYNIPKTKALMIGDNYLWDYKPARNVGIEAVLLQSEYMKKDKRLKVIKNIKEVLKAI